MAAQNKTKALKINLLPQDSFEGKTLGKFLRWALTYGRYIVVFTELFVILAFLSRFKLDRDITDLHEEIGQKQAIIEATYDLEDGFRNLQNRLTKIQTLESSSISPISVLDTLSQYIPTEIYLADLTSSGNKITLTAIAPSEVSFGVFVNNLTNSKKFSNINLGVVTRGGSKEPGLKFNLSAQYSINK